MNVRLSGSAHDYLRSEATYLRAKNPGAARSFLDHMKLALRNLSAFAEMGRESEALPVPGMRRLVAGDYLLDYEIRSGEVHVLAIRHARQSPPIASDDDFDYETGEPE